MTALRPRLAVIDEAWRAAAMATRESTGITPLAVMSGRDGGPLARTVKCLIDPLVLRLRAAPGLGKPLLDEEAAVQVIDLVVAAAPTIADAARWFVELKASRRSAGITGGNIQEQYLPRAFELAVVHGRPAGNAAAIAAEMIDDIHRPRSGKSVDDLAAHIDRHRSELQTALDAVWAGAAPTRHIGADHSAAELLDVVLDDDSGVGERNRSWAGLSSSEVPGRCGLALFDRDSLVSEILGTYLVTAPNQVPALSQSVPPGKPSLQGKDGDAPLDRSIATRVATTLRRTADREDLPEVAELVDAEIERSRAPWALDGPLWHAVMLVGVVVAAQLHPLTPQPCRHGYAQALSRRLAAQAHILYARRVLLGDDPAPEPAAEDTDHPGLATNLREFWRPYLGRLWVRLHGRSVVEPFTDAADFDSDALRDLLDGIARSVSYDQRSRIRAAIERAER
ncbi:MAG: hypothetical protein EKK60_14085 [Gordonia sp. (in: high G+C Gram-positive bacteria)]|nr:MAG: hypothetical protein EKK60_14085 [Gordonia sp. (in: high G+C Gram-positive bacteria)]